MKTCQGIHLSTSATETAAGRPLHFACRAAGRERG